MPQQSKQEPPAREIASARKTITEQDRQLSVNAVSLFKETNYPACLQQLKKLSELRQHDARVASNKATVEYYVSNLCKTDEFMKQLDVAKKQLEFGMVNTGDELDDIDRSFLLYNQAVMNFHLRKFKTAINILERLFKIIEPLGDVLAAKVCTLLIEVYLLNYQLEQAHGMITYMESVILAPKPMNHGEPINEEQHAEFVKNFHPKIRMFKVRLLKMRGFYNQSKQELKLAMSTNKSVEAYFLKSNVEYFQCNYKNAMKRLNKPAKNNNFMETGQPINSMYYNNMACIHFAMKKYNMAVIYAKKAFEENTNVMKSLPPIEKFNHQSGRPLHTLAINKRAELVYNMAVSLLFANKPSAAFECLMECQSSYQCNPRYWLRLAECSVAVTQEAQNELNSSSGKKNEYVQGVTGTGSHRKLVLSPFLEQPIKQQSESHSAAMPAPTLAFANLCLCNATLLMPMDNELESSMTTFLQNERPVPGDEDAEPVKRSFLGRIYVDVPPGHPIQTKEAYYLKGSILCCHAYVALGLAEYHKSLEYSRALLRKAHLPVCQKYLARMYLIESLIKLDKISEAMQELSPDNFKAFAAFDQDIGNLKTMKPFPKNVNEARCMMMFNVASVYAINAEYDKCKHLLRQIMSVEPSLTIRSHAILMAVYCNLQMGQVAAALNLIKRNEVFPSGRLIDRVEAARAMSNMQRMPPAFMQQMQLNELTRRSGQQPPVGFQGSAPTTYPPPGHLPPPQGNVPSPIGTGSVSSSLFGGATPGTQSVIGTSSFPTQ